MTDPRATDKETGDTLDRLDRLAGEEYQLTIKLVEIVRNIEPQLRDLGANYTADRIQAAIGDIDAIVAKQKAIATANPEAIIREYLRRRIGK